MGLPTIVIAFKTTAAAAIQRSTKGTVGLIILDTSATGGHVLTSTTQIPTTWTADNIAFVKQAFIGYQNPPKKVIVYAMAATSASNDALEYMATQEIDYLAAADGTIAAADLVTWVKTQRSNYYSIVKAVVADTTADSEAVINFTTAGIVVGDETYAAKEYVARIAGLLAGTPMSISATYAPLSEVEDVTRLTKAEMDAAIDAGQFIIFNDGTKVKVGRAVNSLTTTTEDKGAAFKKIKTVETTDMIQHDIRMTIQDSYIGKYANSYDNKLLLCTAIEGYLRQLELDGLLEDGTSDVDIDVDAQEAYLISIGVDVSEMTEQEIKEYNTTDKVFIKADITILDTIEDVTLNFTI